MALEGKGGPDWTGRIIGLAVFLIGIGLLVMVFIWTNRTLIAPPGNPKQPIDWAHTGATLAWDLARLFLLGFIAAAIAGRGAQMYAAAGRSDGPRRVPPE
jgi:hypothetical protein